MTVQSTTEPATAVRTRSSGILGWWRRLSPFPGGAWIFSRVLFFAVPYSGTTGARVLELEPGHARIVMNDWRGVRNHLKSVHAIALANVGELASGLAMMCALPSGVRGIVTGIDIVYTKKARGTLIAESRCEVPEVLGSVDHHVHADIRDAAGDPVARVTVKWRLGRA